MERREAEGPPRVALTGRDEPFVLDEGRLDSQTLA
jgi:hypothetical protein